MAEFNLTPHDFVLWPNLVLTRIVVLQLLRLHSFFENVIFQQQQQNNVR